MLQGRPSSSEQKDQDAKKVELNRKVLFAKLLKAIAIADKKMGEDEIGPKLKIFNDIWENLDIHVKALEGSNAAELAMVEDTQFDEIAAETLVDAEEGELKQILSGKTKEMLLQVGKMYRLAYAAELTTAFNAMLAKSAAAAKLATKAVEDTYAEVKQGNAVPVAEQEVKAALPPVQNSHQALQTKIKKMSDVTRLRAETEKRQQLLEQSLEKSRLDLVGQFAAETEQDVFAVIEAQAESKSVKSYKATKIARQQKIQTAWTEVGEFMTKLYENRKQFVFDDTLPQLRTQMRADRDLELKLAASMRSEALNALRAQLAQAKATAEINKQQMDEYVALKTKTSEFVANIQREEKLFLLSIDNQKHAVSAINDQVALPHHQVNELQSALNRGNVDVQNLQDLHDTASGEMLRLKAALSACDLKDADAVITAVPATPENKLSMPLLQEQLNNLKNCLDDVIALRKHAQLQLDTEMKNVEAQNGRLIADLTAQVEALQQAEAQVDAEMVTIANLMTQFLGDEAKQEAKQQNKFVMPVSQVNARCEELRQQFVKATADARSEAVTHCNNRRSLFNVDQEAKIAVTKTVVAKRIEDQLERLAQQQQTITAMKARKLKPGTEALMVPGTFTLIGGVVGAVWAGFFLASNPVGWMLAVGIAVAVVSAGLLALTGLLFRNVGRRVERQEYMHKFRNNPGLQVDLCEQNERQKQNPLLKANRDLRMLMFRNGVHETQEELKSAAHQEEKSSWKKCTYGINRTAVPLFFNEQACQLKVIQNNQETLVDEKNFNQVMSPLVSARA